MHKPKGGLKNKKTCLYLLKNPELYQRAKNKQNDNNYEIIKEDHNRR